MRSIQFEEILRVNGICWVDGQDSQPSNSSVPREHAGLAACMVQAMVAAKVQAALAEDRCECQQPATEATVMTAVVMAAAMGQQELQY